MNFGDFIKESSEYTMKTTPYTEKDIFELAYIYANPSDAHADLGFELMKRFRRHPLTMIYKKHYSDENLADTCSIYDYVSSDKAYEAFDELIELKTGVTLEKIQYYSEYIWQDNHNSTRKVYYNHFLTDKSFFY
jgi:hypothetical protein